MNKILPLFEESFVLDYFRRELLPLYPSFSGIERVEIKPYKKLVWETTYHVVVGFRVFFLSPDGDEIKIPIVCSAHSDEPRQNVYQALQYLRQCGLGGHGVDLPRPLFYSEYFNGTFYRALSGENLLHYIKNNDKPEITKIVAEAAELFARLHSLPAVPAANFNPANSHIPTVIPGVEMILREIDIRFAGRYSADLEKIYARFIKQENDFFTSTKELFLIHGDAHPENILKTAENNIGVIDFTDFCLGDFARDLGAFLQQLEYKINNKVGEIEFAESLKKLFLDTYLKAAGKKLDKNLQQRIDLYYNWTAIRTATYWLLKAGHNEERGAYLLGKVKENLKV